MTSILDPNLQEDDTLTEIEPVDPDKDYFSELVGEDKKYKTQKDAGRALVEKDAFIERLKREKSELYEDLKVNRATKRLEDMLDQLQTFNQKKEDTLSNDDNHSREPEQQISKSPQFTLEDVENLINRKKNRDEVVDKITKSWGKNYVSKLKETATQLNVGLDYLNDLAVNSPTAFYRLVGIDEHRKEGVDVNLPRSSMSTSLSKTESKNWAYYEKMRKSDPVRYHSISTSNEMHNEALKQGADFYAS